MRGLRWVMGGALALATACVAGMGSSSAEVTEAARPVVVRVATVQAAPEGRGLVVHGVTRSRQRGQLGFVDGGRVVERTVELGQSVASGTVLARLDPQPYRNQATAAWAQVAQLQARSTQLEADRQRLGSLQPGKTVSTAELDRVSAEADAVRAALDAARASAVEADRRASEAVLRAPYAGVVMAVSAEPGELVAPGQPVVELAGDGRLEVEVQVPESSWATLRVGAPAQVHMPALSRRAEGTVVQVASAARPEGLFPVVVSIDAPDLVAGLTAEVRLQMPLAADVAVPVAAVIDPVGRSPAVLRVVDGVAERVEVEAAELLPGGVALRGDLAPGDEVVVAGHGRLLDGDPVDVIEVVP